MSSVLRIVTTTAAVITLAAGTFAVGAAVSSEQDRPAATPPPSPAATNPEADADADPVDTSETEVDIVGFAFAPLDVEAPAGSTIAWTNDDDVAHNVFTADGRFASEDLALGDTYSVTVDEAGTIDYYCDIHQYMRGTITVTP